jgi:DNA repair protein RadD
MGDKVMFTPRPYQTDAIDVTISHIRTTLDSCLLELATGAGKSIIVSEIAKWVKDTSGKRVLCLAPSKELVEQNRKAYLSYGEPASMFSASAGAKCLKHNVVFGSPQTVVNSIEKFGDKFAAVVIDEAHGVTPTIKKIVGHMKEKNPKIRIIGLTATPYRRGSGYIYEIDENGNYIGEDETKNPFFKKLICRVTAPFLIEQGYLTEPIADVKEGYDTSGLEMSRTNKFTAESIERAFEGQGRKTALIVGQVVSHSIGKMGVMIFASTVQHAKEVMASLPPDLSRIVTCDTPKSDRKKIIDSFKEMKFKYLVNVSVLTTGFDAPHVDVIAVLRATESASLFQQIIGRGLRLHEDKKNCLILDYAENIARHNLEDDLFSPTITVPGGGSAKMIIEAKCETCGTVNEFSGRPNKDDLGHDENGYFVDLTKKRVKSEDGQFLPAHFGRRCTASVFENNTFIRCSGRWSMKVCPDCDTENDIAARYCTSCRGELVDPNEKLNIDFARIKKNPHIMSTDKVKSWYAQKWISKKGNETLRIDWTTDYRTFSAWYSPESRSLSGQKLWSNLSESVFGEGRIAPNIDQFVTALQKGHGNMPKTITSKKDGNFFKVYSHNQPEDTIDEL